MARNFPNNNAHFLGFAGDAAALKFGENNHSFSIHLWYRPTNATSPADQALLAKYPGTGSRGWLLRNNNGKIGMFWIDSGSAGNEALSTSSFSSGVWTSVGVSYNTSTDTMTAWFNGTAEGTDTGNFHSSYTAFFRAGLRSNSQNPLNGDLAEIAIWDNIILTTEEFGALAKGVPAPRVNPNYLAYWPLYGTVASGGNEINQAPTSLDFPLSNSPQTDHPPVGR